MSINEPPRTAHINQPKSINNKTQKKKHIANFSSQKFDAAKSWVTFCCCCYCCLFPRIAISESIKQPLVLGDGHIKMLQQTVASSDNVQRQQRPHYKFVARWRWPCWQCTSVSGLRSVHKAHLLEQMLCVSLAWLSRQARKEGCRQRGRGSGRPQKRNKFSQHQRNNWKPKTIAICRCVCLHVCIDVCLCFGVCLCLYWCVWEAINKIYQTSSATGRQQQQPEQYKGAIARATGSDWFMPVTFPLCPYPPPSPGRATARSNWPQFGLTFLFANLLLMMCDEEIVELFSRFSAAIVATGGGWGSRGAWWGMCNDF